MFAKSTIEPSSRRTFCKMAGFGILGIFVSSACASRQKVLKYPESAEDIADFFEFFTTPTFDVQAAINGLKITGEPKVFDASKTWRRTTYPKQNEFVRSIELSTDPVQLTSIYIYYDREISVSLGRLEGRCGKARNYGGMTVGSITPQLFSGALILSNIDTSKPIRRGPPPSDSFGFSPKPSNAEAYSGSILISTDNTDDNVKKVDMIRFERSKQTS